MAQQNSPELWDALWSESIAPERDRYELARERLNVRWRKMESRVLETFGSFEGLRVLEIGAGAGTVSGLFALLGAHVTVLDYSPVALERSREYFANNGLEADFVEADALDLPPELLGAFDVCMSFGLAEHFRDEPRQRIITAHAQALAPGGVTFVSVPNRACPPYRLYKVLAELLGVWKVGEEYPFSVDELAQAGRAAALSDVDVFGDSFLGSFRFFSPVRVYRKLFKRPEPTDITRLKPQAETSLDDSLGYAIVLFGRATEHS